MKALDKLTKLVTEAKQSPLSWEDAKAGVNVIFKEGTPHAGMMGFIVQTHPERKTVDLKFGKATKMDVSISDLIKVENEGGVAKDKGASESVEAVDEDEADDVAFEAELVEDATNEDEMDSLNKQHGKLQSKHDSIMRRLRGNATGDSERKKSWREEAKKLKGQIRAIMDKKKNLRQKNAAKNA